MTCKRTAALAGAPRSPPPAGPPASLLPPSDSAPFLSHTHPPAPSGGRTPGRRSCGATRVQRRARRPAHSTGAGSRRAALCNSQAYDRAGGQGARPGTRTPLPGARPRESERRAPARTPETELYYLAPSRASLLAGHSNSFPTSPAKDFFPLSLVAVRPSVPAGGRRRRREESGKRKKQKLEPSDPTTNTPVINPPPLQICLSSRYRRRSLLVSALSLLLG